METDEAKFQRMLACIRNSPSTPPSHLSEDSKVLYLAAKETLNCENVLRAQQYLYCKHPMSFMIRPVFDAVFESIMTQLY